MAKWAFYVLVFIYMCYRAVYGVKLIDTSISVDAIDYGDQQFLEVGSQQTVTCKASNKIQKLDWTDPSGNPVKRIPSNRVYAQEHSESSSKGRQGLVLTFADLQVADSGVYQCKTGEQKKSVRVCVIKPAEFLDSPDSPSEVMIESGRAITLSCQASGDPEPKIEWTKNNIVLTEDEEDSKYKINKRFKMEGYESLLTITSVDPEDDGLYNCVAFQENAMLENCTSATTKNITLLVKNKPTFRNGKNIQNVYGDPNEIVDLTCEAMGYPKPTYRFFKDLSGGSFYEFNKSKIIFTDDPNTATLSVKAGLSTYDRLYKCTASNDLGDEDQYFKIVKREKPTKVDKVKPFIISSTRVFLNVSWDNPIKFPVDEIVINYAAEGSLSLPREVIKKDFKGKDSVYLVTLEGLRPGTRHALQLRASNAAGDGPWSDTLEFSTTGVAESNMILLDKDLVIDADEVDPEMLEEGESTSGMFYGIFFTGGILIVAVVCMFAMRLV